MFSSDQSVQYGSYSSDQPFGYYESLQDDGNGKLPDADRNFMAGGQDICVAPYNGNGHTKGWWSTQFKDGKARHVSDVVIMPREDHGGDSGKSRLEGACVRLQREGDDSPSSAPSASPDGSDCDFILPSRGLPGVKDTSAITVAVNENIVGFKIITAASDNYLEFCGIKIYGTLEGALMDPNRATRKITAETSAVWSPSPPVEGQGLPEERGPEQALTFQEGVDSTCHGGDVDCGDGYSPGRYCFIADDNPQASWTATFEKPTNVKALKLFNRRTSDKGNLHYRLDFGRVFYDDNTSEFDRLPEISDDRMTGTTLLIDRTVTKITIKITDFDYADPYGVPAVGAYDQTFNQYLTICGARFYQNAPTDSDIALADSTLALAVRADAAVGVLSETEVAGAAFKIAAAKLSALVKIAAKSISI